MSKPRILISLLTWEQTREESFCRPFLELLFGTPELAPELASNFEPINNATNSVETALPYCKEDPFLWLRKHSITSQGGLYHRYPHVGGTITLEAVYKEGFDWLGILRRLVSIAKADYGYLHLVTDQERNTSRLGVEDAQVFYSLGAISKTLEGGFLNLGWANYFGPRWKSQINAIKLRSACSHFEHIESGYLFSVTDDVTDVKLSYEQFDERRQAVRAAFSNGFFRP